MRWRRPTPQATDAGFTVVEVVVAMAVFIVISTATVAILITAIRTVRENGDRVLASTLARTEIERVRGLSTEAITIGQVTTTVATAQGEYTVRTTSNWAGLNATANACASSSPGQAFIRVDVEVSGGALGAPQSMSTLVAPPDEIEEGTTGKLTIEVLDERDKPVSDVVVSGRNLVAGGASFTAVTGPDGCLFLPGLAPSASWQLSVARAGFVPKTTNGATQIVQVASKETTRTQFYFAAASSLLIDAPAPRFPIPAGMPVSYGADPMLTSVVTNTTFPLRIDRLWPAVGGYQVWLGSCKDADPAFGSPPRTIAGNRDWFAVAPGEQTDVAVTGVNVKVRGLPANASVKAVHPAEGGTGPCKNELAFDLEKSSALGISRATLPFGRWTIRTPGAPDKTILLEPGMDTELVEFALAQLDVDATASPSPTSTSTATPTASPTPTSTP